MKGNTLYICWGDSGGFRFECGKHLIRLCLWRVSFAYMRLDVEKMMDELVKSKGIE